MSEQFKLVFRGEIEDDQHLAVVRKRLGKLLKADDKTLVALFSGQAVVLRRDIDAAGAAKFQAAFKKAGAKLRVIPHAGQNQMPAAAAGTPPPKPAQEAPRKLSLAERLKAEEEAEARNAGEAPSQPGPLRTAAGQGAVPEPHATDADGLRLYPVGADLVETHEGPPPVHREVDTSHLTVAEVGALIGPVVAMMADTERFLEAAAAFELADAGSDMAPPDAENVAPLPAPELGLAPAGAALLEGVPSVASPDVPAPALDLSEPGAILVDPAAPSQTKAPDTTHLELVDEPTQD